VVRVGKVKMASVDERDKARSGQARFYDQIKKWLEGEGFRPIVVGTRPIVTVPVQDLAAANLYKVPDLVGVSDLPSLGDCALIVEVESDPKRFLCISYTPEA